MSLPVDVVRQRLSAPTLVTVIKTLRGGSQSRLVLCSDGNLYVLKTHPNPQGPNVLANEAIGSILLQGLGLPAPPWKPVRIDLKAVRFFPELATTTHSAQLQLPSCGLHFGSQYLGGADHAVFDFIPDTRLNKSTTTSQFVGIYLFDIWANHQDERQCVFRQAPGERVYEMQFIDNGHLFGGPQWSDMARRCRQTHSLPHQPIAIGDPETEYWLQLFQLRIPQLLSQAIAVVPKDWYVDDIQSLYQHLLRRLASIRTLVQGEIHHQAQFQRGRLRQ